MSDFQEARNRYDARLLMAMRPVEREARMEFEREVRMDQREKDAEAAQGVGCRSAANVIRASAIDSESEPAPLSTVY